MTRWSALWFSVFGLASMGCGDGDPKTDDPTAGTLLPWKEGNSWTYNVTDKDGEVTTKTTTIMGLEPVGGSGPNKDVMANKVVTEKENGADETHSFQAVVGDTIVRYRELSFDMAGGSVELEEYWDPFKLRVDDSAEHTTVGKTWVEKYAEAKITTGSLGTPSMKADIWTVLKTDEKVTVPAGEFQAIVLQRASGSDSVKQYFFVRGIGKVKETGGQTEELVSYNVP